MSNDSDTTGPGDKSYSPDPHSPSTARAPDILYVGAFRIPHDGPGAGRVLGTAKALRAAGYTVAFIGGESRSASRTVQPDGPRTEQGFTYLPDRRDPRIRGLRLYWLREALLGSSIWERVCRSDLGALKGIIAYDAPALLLWKLLRLCRQRGIFLIGDSTEWYDPTHVLLGRWGPFRWDSELRVRRCYPRCSGLFPISAFLEEYYRAHGGRTLRIPPLVDLEEDKWPRQPRSPADQHRIRLGFAGSVGKKELVGNAIRALALLTGEEARRITFSLVGTDRAELARNLRQDSSLLDRFSSQVLCHGQVSHTQALARVAECDFSILLRPAARFSLAGFPTKLVESLACGVPVIGNLTSNMADYVRDGIEGLVVPDTSPAAFAVGVRRALALAPDERSVMRTASRQRARESFDYHGYVESVLAFVGTLEPPAAGRLTQAQRPGAPTRSASSQPSPVLALTNIHRASVV